jgi:hypothetical protein
VFADQRASAPIPMPTQAPPAPVAAPVPIALPARAPASRVPGEPAPQAVPATPSAFGAAAHPAPATGLRPGYTGFTPATRPLPPAPLAPPPAPLPPPAFAPPQAFAPSPGFVPSPPAPLTPAAPAPATSTSFAPVATRGTIAPRFAARLAEEAARVQAAVPVSPPSPIPSAFLPPPAQDAPAAPPIGSALTPHAAPSWQTPHEPAPAPAYAPTPAYAPEPLPAPAPEPAFGPAPSFASAPPAFAPAPPATFAPTPSPIPAPEPAPASIPVVPEYIPPSIAARRAPMFAPPPAPETAQAHTPLATPVPVPPWPPAKETPPSAADLASDFAAPAPTPASPDAMPEADGPALASVSADDASDDARAGPPTLASMLPEDAGDWPPKRAKKRAVSAETSELEIVDRTKDPRFLREAKAGARWRRPWVRAVLGVTLLLLMLAAVGQVAWPQRDTLASRWPATLPAWNWLCEQADCKIEAPRAIASLALDGSSLTRTDTEHVLLFSADLHNRADHEVRMPSFDLTFMDLNGEIVARKVLSPEQIGIHQASLPPEGELHVHARLQVGTLPASGFQADLFYP